MSATKLSNAVDDYNRRLLKLCQDFYDLTRSEQALRFRHFIEYNASVEEDKYVILARHIDSVDTAIFERVLVQNDMTVLDDTSLGHKDVSSDILTHLRACWKDVPSSSKATLFRNVQNIFRIADYVHVNHHETLLGLCI